MFSVITNIYNKKTKGPTLMEFFTATGKLKKFFFFWELEMFDVCKTRDTAHGRLLPHTRQHDVSRKAVKNSVQEPLDRTLYNT
jgi:hypothetical protein